MTGIRLRHIHLPSSSAEGVYPSYKTAAAIQELLRRRLLDFKDAEASSSRPAPTPHPTLISFTPQPTYTLGRRQAQTPSSSPASSSASLSPAEIARLKAPLHIRSTRADSLPTLGTSDDDKKINNSNKAGITTEASDHVHVFHPSVLTSPRGGLATYHGPGQVVLWPVMTINASAPLGYKHFTVRCYSRLLENTTIALLDRLFGLKGFTTEDPGVWVRTPPTQQQQQQQQQQQWRRPTSPPPESDDVNSLTYAHATSSYAGVAGSRSDGGEVRKISALGIHLRRHVSSLGAAINLDMPTITHAATYPPGSPIINAEDDGMEKFNPWARFLACGLAGKGVTCVKDELRAAGAIGIPGLDSEIVARTWAEELATRMDLDPHGIETVARDEVDELTWIVEKEGYLDAMGKDEL